VDFELLLRQRETQQTEAAFIGALIKDYLKPDATGALGSWARERRRFQLMDYARKGLLGLGAEKAAAIKGHPTPCEELWQRIQRAG